METNSGLTQMTDRYHLQRSWPHWNILCGNGTQVIHHTYRWITAARWCAALNRAYDDGYFVGASHAINMSENSGSVSTRTTTAGGYSLLFKDRGGRGPGV